MKGPAQSAFWEAVSRSFPGLGGEKEGREGGVGKRNQHPVWVPCLCQECADLISPLSPDPLDLEAGKMLSDSPKVTRLGSGGIQAQVYPKHGSGPVGSEEPHVSGQQSSLAP